MTTTALTMASRRPNRPVTSLRVAALLIALLLVPLVSVPAQAQDDPQTQQVLPDIAPRVVEIRGNLELSLPSLQRQPLVGFNPPPRVAPIPPDRRPFVEDYKQESIDLPPSPLTPPEPPPVASLIGGDPLNGSLEAAGGFYLTRSLDFHSEWAMTDAASVYSRLDYAGSKGHKADLGLEDDVNASFDGLDALVGIQNVSSWAAFGFELGGFVNRYRMFGALPAAGYAALRDKPPTRDGRGGDAELWIRTQATAGVDLDLSIRYGVASYETDALSDTEIADPIVDATDFARDEASIAIDSRLDLPLRGGNNLLADARFTGLGFDGSTVGNDVNMLDAGGGMQFDLGRSLQVTALARIMTYSEGDSSSAFYVTPDLRMDMYPTQGLRLYLLNDARAEHRSTTSMYRVSPYLVDHPLVQPTVYTVDARGGARLQAGVFEADIHAGYSRAPNYRYFERADNEEAHGYRRGMVAARYDNAAITYVGGDLSINFPAGLQVSGGLTWRDGMLTDGDVDIPYFGSLLARSGLSFSFLERRAFIEAVMTYESAREVDRVGSRRVGDYFDLDIDASYRLTDVLGVLVRLQNFSSGYLERWEYHDGTPFVVSAGIRAQW